MKHKKEFVLLLLIGFLISGLVTAAASEAGSSGDPFVALKWLQDTFFPQAEEDVKDHIDDQLDGLKEYLFDAGTTGSEKRVKRGDVIRLESGSSLTALAGELSVSASGAILDVTDGTELSGAGGAILTNHRYLAAENTTAAFSVTTDTAVIRLTGVCQLNPSQETDYNALADALHGAGMFEGSTVPYGSGYELERTPTRTEGIIMLLRLLGEIEEASQFQDPSVTFADVPKWALPFVSFAYHKGYTAGRGVNAEGQVVFGATDPLTPRDYITFTMLALGYTGEDFTWKNAVSDVRDMGILTDGEAALLSEKPFLRAQVVYVSWVALFTKTAGEESTLLDSLISMGVIDQAASDEVFSKVTVQRL